MIRVFLIALLALAALTLVAINLPETARAPRQAGGAPGGAPSLARWEGMWEGTLRTYRPDGRMEESIEESRYFTRVSPVEHSIEITRRLASGRQEELKGAIVAAAGGQLQHRLRTPGGTVLLTGGWVGPAVFWHRRDPAAGIQEGLREEVVASAEGDLYTLDGARVLSPGGRLLLLEGRYRRADRTYR